MEDYKKKYEDALERAKSYQKWNKSEVITAIFPELKENVDVRIRQDIITTLSIGVSCHESALHPGAQTTLKEAITWLEKQGEQNLVDNVEPKFKVGDFIVNDYGLGRVVELTDDAYLLDTEQGIPFSCHNTRLWDITKDAKDGDVLAANECIVLFKEIDGLNIKCHCTYHFMNNPSFFVNTLQNKSAFHPATKERRDLLFKRMKEAGYEWDTKKKELKKF